MSTVALSKCAGGIDGRPVAAYMPSKVGNRDRNTSSAIFLISQIVRRWGRDLRANAAASRFASSRIRGCMRPAVVRSALSTLFHHLTKPFVGLGRLHPWPLLECASCVASPRVGAPPRRVRSISRTSAPWTTSIVCGRSARAPIGALAELFYESLGAKVLRVISAGKMSHCRVDKLLVSLTH